MSTPSIPFAQLTFQIKTIPDSIHPDQDIYLASSLSNWNPGHPDFKLTKNENGELELTISPMIGALEYKFTRGSWETVETLVNGEDLPNRKVIYEGIPQTIQITISGWKDELSTMETKKSTATQNVHILDEKFYMPQLYLDRKIWIYLPPDYESSSKKYPVVYMHDGQNLFDAATSFNGEWEVDESLNELHHQGDEGIIVVGIENGGPMRVEEYSPWTHPKYGGGDGEKYVDFIVKTLKPYVDKTYRTKSDRLHTGIIGSSLGGLISFYAAVKHQNVFGKAGILSPSFWFSDEVYELVEEEGKMYDIQFYFLGGELESETLIDEIQAMVTSLKVAGFENSEIKLVTHPDGEHNEQFWRRTFKDCYVWLFR